MIDKINQKIEDLRINIDELQHSSTVADKLGFLKELGFIASIMRERIDFRNFLMTLVRENKEKDLK